MCDKYRRRPSSYTPLSKSRRRTVCWIPRLWSSCPWNTTRSSGVCAVGERRCPGSIVGFPRSRPAVGSWRGNRPVPYSGNPQSAAGSVARNRPRPVDFQTLSRTWRPTEAACSPVAAAAAAAAVSGRLSGRTGCWPEWTGTVSRWWGTWTPVAAVAAAAGNRGILAVASSRKVADVVAATVVGPRCLGGLKEISFTRVHRYSNCHLMPFEHLVVSTDGGDR